MSLDYDYLLKIIVIGDSGIGKSCILTRFADGEYNPNYITTIGVDFKIKTIFFDGKTIKLQMWDTAGQERFRTITTSYYRGCHLVIVCYDITDRESFDNLDMWLENVRRYAVSTVKIVLCGTKTDLHSRRVISTEEGQKFANEYGYDFYELSSKNNENIDTLFELSSQQIINNLNNKKLTSTDETKTFNNARNVMLEGTKITDYNKCC
jgi:Ras-related protein Rab-1A